MIKRVRKRDGRIVDFDKNKVENVIWKAASAIGGQDKQLAVQLRQKVIEFMEKHNNEEIPSVEDVQDAIERVLIEQGHSQTAKAFILYRKKRQELREAKAALGIQDDMKLSFDALRILAQYKLLQRKSDGTLETPRQMFERTAKALSKAEKKFGGDGAEFEKQLIDAFISLEIMPSTSILQMAGSTGHHLSESFVLPLEDDIGVLFDTLKLAAQLHKTRQRGFGLGISFSPLRSKGSRVGDAEFGEGASGPVSFLMLYDRALRQINPHGTNLAFLSVHHPDIIDFITSKENAQLRNFGISVVLSKEFMRAVQEDKMYKLIDPHTKFAVTKLRARSVLDMIATIAWRTGDPAVVFSDNLNKAPSNPFEGIDGGGKNGQSNQRQLELLEATTQTGEHPLFAYESCFTASINLAQHTQNMGAGASDINWDKLKKNVHLTVRLLDNAIEVSDYPTAMMKRAIERTRRIGVGVMGWADLLIALEVPYNRAEALTLAEKVMNFVNTEAKNASMTLAKKRGVFEGFDKSVYAKKGEKLRNSSRTTVVHSGITSVIAGCSQGIEPHYAIGYLKRTPTAETFEVIPVFENIARREGFYSTELMKTISLAGSVRRVKDVPAKWRRVFVTAHDCTISDHGAMQIAFQKYTDNGVSKTINLPATATIHEVEEVVLRAYEAGCRSIHVYREGSSAQQLIHSKTTSKKKKVAGV